MAAALQPVNEEVEEFLAEQKGQHSHLICPRGEGVQREGLEEQDEEGEEGYQEEKHQIRGKFGFFLTGSNFHTA